MKSSGIGGQAVMEGVMMKNKEQYAVAVRKPDKMIEVKVEQYQGIAAKHPIFKWPILRGIAAFAESMTIGMKTLTYSASFYEEEEAKPSKLETTMGKMFKEKAESIVLGLTVALSVLAAIAIFMVLPFFIAEFFKDMTDNATLLALLEGLIRMTIFIIYIAAISRMEDIRRVFMYHGAEHKSINCVENGEELTVENVRSQSRYHKRCGTSFLFIVMFISILFFMVVRVDDVALRMVSRVLLVPIIAGVSFEFIRLAGQSDNSIVNLLSKPGMWLQALTTREPEDDMIEVAIRSVEAVFDWRAYQEEVRQEEVAKEAAEREAAEKAAKEAAEREAAEKAAKEAAEQEAAEKAAKEAAEREAAEKAEKAAKEAKEAAEREAAEKAAKEAAEREATEKAAKVAKEAAEREAAEKAAKAAKEAAEKAAEQTAAGHQAEEAVQEEKPAFGTTIRAAVRAKNSRTVRQTKRERERSLAEREGYRREYALSMESISQPGIDEDDDEILKALDKYFDEIE